MQPPVVLCSYLRVKNGLEHIQWFRQHIFFNMKQLYGTLPHPYEHCSRQQFEQNALYFFLLLVYGFDRGWYR